MGVPVWPKRDCRTASNPVTRILYNGRSLGTPSNADKLTIYLEDIPTTEKPAAHLDPGMAINWRKSCPSFQRSHIGMWPVVVEHLMSTSISLLTSI